MKSLYLLTLAILVSLSSFAQTYRIYTAKKSGMWNDITVWTITTRTDGVKKDKMVIPTGFTVSADNAVNGMGFTDVELEITGVLSVLANSNILLGANSTISIFTGGSIVGTVTSQKISIGGVVKYDGNLDKTKTGAKIADALTSTAPNGFRALSVLSVKFISFTATKNADQSVSLAWATTAEINNSHFEIEMSVNGKDWNKIGTVKAGTSNLVNNYYYVHYKAVGTMISYRLRQVDKDGQFDYSTVAVVRMNPSNEAAVYAVNQIINISFKTALSAQATVNVYAINGNLVATQLVQKGSSRSSINLKDNAGIYIVQVTDNATYTETKKLML